jgi:L-2-hydroxyglutarate oxidase LhgO
MKLGERFPTLRLLILEKEDGIARHQTGHNSGVIHGGIYYKPGSLKAATASRPSRAAGVLRPQRHRLRALRQSHRRDRRRGCPRLEELYRRGTANEVPGLQVIGPERLRRDRAARARRARDSFPATGIIDFVQVAEAYAKTCARRR